VRAHEGSSLYELVLAADDRRWLDRQVRPVERLQRRELAVAELVETLRRRQVLEAVLAEVAQRRFPVE
jgi:hypothetical protein